MKRSYNDENEFTEQDVRSTHKKADGGNSLLSSMIVVNYPEILTRISRLPPSFGFSKHSGGRAQNTVCPCVRNGIQNFVLAKHLGECCIGVTKPRNWLRGDIGLASTLMPATPGWSSIVTTDASTWPSLTISIEHLTNAYATEEWALLSPVRMLPSNVNSVIWAITMEYMPARAERISQFSLPTVVRARMTQRRGMLGLYGISCELDNNFLDTPQGTVHFMHCLEQMAMGYDQATNLATANTICNVMRANCHRMPGVDSNFPTIQQWSNDLKRSFGRLQRTAPNTWGVLERYLRDKLRFQRGSYQDPTFSFVMPNQCVTALCRLNKDAVKYAWAGDAGPSQYQSPNHLGLFQMWGSQVFSMAEFTMPEHNFHQPLERLIEVGEYATMLDETRPGKTYEKSYRDRQVFTNRGFMTITFEDAVKHCQLFKEDGNIREGFDIETDAENIFPYIKSSSKAEPPKHMYELKWGDYGISKDFMDEVAKDIMAEKDIAFDKLLEKFYVTKEAGLKALRGESKNTVDRAALAFTSLTAWPDDENADALELMKYAYLMLPFNKKTILKLHNHNIRVPIGFLLVQPHKVYRAMDCVGIIPGAAIETVMCPGSAWIEDAINGKRVVVANKRMGNIVTNDKNIVGAEAVFLSQYRRGEGVEPLKPDDYEPGDWKWTGDMIYIMVPHNWRVTPEVLALPPTDQFLKMAYQSEMDFQKKYSYPSAFVYEEIFQWNHKQFARPDMRPDRSPYGMDPCPINMLCRMMTFRKRAEDGHFTHWVKGNGYWDMDATYDGAEQHRFGDSFGVPEYGHHTLESSI